VESSQALGHWCTVFHRQSLPPASSVDVMSVAFGCFNYMETFHPSHSGSYGEQQEESDGRSSGFMLLVIGPSLQCYLSSLICLMFMAEYHELCVDTVLIT
jgi:hypothetical protein